MTVVKEGRKCVVGGVAGAPCCPMTFRTAWATIAKRFYLLPNEVFYLKILKGFLFLFWIDLCLG